jgi:hypothetical protein
MGPFLILGLDKDASPEEVDKAWRERLQWVEQGWSNVSCDDLNWAHDVLLDPERRVAADAASLNPDTLAQPCRHLLTTSESADWEQPSWPILDDAWPELPPFPPDLPENRASEVGAAPIPEIPREVPALTRLIKQWLDRPIDPWIL